jgi:hypothetical protein
MGVVEYEPEGRAATEGANRHRVDFASTGDHQ